jgi:hypothetical protein
MGSRRASSRAARIETIETFRTIERLVSMPDRLGDILSGGLDFYELRTTRIQEPARSVRVPVPELLAHRKVMFPEDVKAMLPSIR